MDVDVVGIAIAKQISMIYGHFQNKTSIDPQCYAIGIVQSAIAGRLAVMLLQNRADRSVTSLIGASSASIG